jgi:hypothetical protein
VSIEPALLLEQMSATLRHDIGPEVGDPFARTQAFMAAVVLAKLAGQLRSAAEDARADGVEHVAVSQAVRATAGAALPDALDAALDALAADGATARWNAVVEATYVARAELGEATFERTLAVLRTALRARLDRALAYAR